MYIDCKTCGYESKCFCPLGPDYHEAMMAGVEGNGCSAIKKEDGSYVIKCPNGHDADYLPTEIKFMKRHPDFKVS